MGTDPDDYRIAPQETQNRVRKATRLALTAHKAGVKPQELFSSASLRDALVCITPKSGLPIPRGGWWSTWDHASEETWDLVGVILTELLAMEP